MRWCRPFPFPLAQMNNNQNYIREYVPKVFSSFHEIMDMFETFQKLSGNIRWVGNHPIVLTHQVVSIR